MDDDLGEEPLEDMDIPWDQLSAEALRGVVEEFVTREGTEYGAEDVPLEQKVDEVLAQLRSGDVIVRFDGKERTVNLVRRDGCG